MEKDEREAPPSRKVVSIAVGNGPRGAEIVALDDTGVIWRVLLGEDSKFLRWQAVPELPAEIPT